MKSRGKIDLYLPTAVAYHVKIVLFSLVFACVFSLINRKNGYSDLFQLTFVLLFIQLETFIWVGSTFFRSVPGKSNREKTRNIILRFLLFNVTCFILAALIYVAVSGGYYLVHGYDLSLLVPALIRDELRGFLIGTNFGLLVGSIIFFYLQWQDALKREQQLKEEQLVFRYETLKNQINPHFLFNSLNTLSSLVYSNQELAETYISKLSAIYRYILEQKDNELVSLSEELKFSSDYFRLQQIRDEHKIHLEMADNDASHYKILPISVQLLLENAFKHNAATRENPLNIQVFIENETYLVVRNNLQKRLVLDGSTGTGLKNLGERTRLITGKEIVILETKEIYSVKVPLIKT
jgi:sensor histidine kinase YesM